MNFPGSAMSRLKFLMYPVIVLGTLQVFSCLSNSRQDLRIGFSDLDRHL